MTTTVPLETMVSASRSASSSPEHRGPTCTPIKSSSAPDWSMKHSCLPLDPGQEDEDGSEHPLVSKASHGSSSASHHHSPPTPPPHPQDGLLVSELSNESPASAVQRSSRGPAQSPTSGEASGGGPSPLKDPKEWYHRSAAEPWPLMASPISPSSKHGKVATNNNKRGELVRFQPSPASGGWPQRSHIKNEHDPEVASFGLLTQSFDTLSEAGAGGQHHYQHHPSSSWRASPEKNVAAYSLNHIQQHRHHQQEQYHQRPPRKIQVVGGEEEMNDISPIKLDPRAEQNSSLDRPPDDPSSRVVHYHHLGEQQQQQRRPQYHHYSHSSDAEVRDRIHSSEPSPTTTHAPVGIFRGPHLGRDQEPAAPYDPPHGRAAHPPSTYNESGYSTTGSNPFFVLKSVRQVFDHCTYRLAFLDDQANDCPVHLNHPAAASIHLFQNDGSSRPTFLELETARRRVDTAIHAFGGYCTKPPSHESSIFRDRRSWSKEYYNNIFHKRYIVAGNHISWEMENNPPVLLDDSRSEGNPGARRGDESSSSVPDLQDGPDHRGGDTTSTGSLVPMDQNDGQKMRYRCKLCGQLKQNHNCPYHQSLQRNIAVMVYPAVNAYTACEPGVLTKPLSAMNNFVSYDDSSGFSPPADHELYEMDDGRIPHVTPETKMGLLYSPESTLSTRSGHDHLQQQQQQQHHCPPPYPLNDPSTLNFCGPRKRSRPPFDAMPPSSNRPTMNGSSARCFVPSTVALRPEHYRGVTPHLSVSSVDNGSGSNEEYKYPHVPLSLEERKRLSDTLFFLSYEIPTMTSYVAPLLRLSREKGEWDMAVAQVLTQLVVSLYCPEGDFGLDGLQRYLLEIGISC